jgi:hypothetical protein
VLQYYILPAKLVRKRHRDKERATVYCRPCYEKDPELSFKVDGKGYSVPKAPSRDAREGRCVVCGGKASAPDQLYGVITPMSPPRALYTGTFPLAHVCSSCAENCQVDL